MPSSTRRVNSRAARSLVTSSQLYSVAEKPTGPVPSSIYSFDNVSRSSNISDHCLSPFPPPPPKSSRRLGHARTKSQINTHLAHLFGAPQCHDQRDSIDSLSQSYGGLAWNPEELRLSTASSPRTTPSTSRCSNAGPSRSCWNMNGRRKQRDLIPSRAALDDMQPGPSEKTDSFSSSSSEDSDCNEAWPPRNAGYKSHRRKTSSGGPLLLKLKNGKVCRR